MHSHRFENELYSLDWSVDGKVIIVGDSQGDIHSVSAHKSKEPLKIIDTANSSNEYEVQKGPDHLSFVQDVKIASDSSYVAWCRQNSYAVEIATIDFKSGKLTKNYSIPLQSDIESSITHIDWSEDGEVLAVNTQNNGLYFIHVTDKREISASKVRDLKWKTWSCKFGWPV